MSDEKKVLSLVPPNPAPNRELVEQLRMILEEAERGDIQDMLGVYASASNETTHFYGLSEKANAPMLVGELEIAKQFLIQNFALPQYQG